MTKRLHLEVTGIGSRPVLPLCGTNRGFRVADVATTKDVGKITCLLCIKALARAKARK